MEEHQLTCPRKPKMCEFCKKFQAPEREFKEHKKLCPARLATCPNGCGGMMKPSNVKAHVDNKCPLSVVSCEFAYAGCLSMMLCKDMKDHLEVAQQNHLMLLSDKYKEMEKEMKQLKSEIAEKDQKIKQLNKSLHLQERGALPVSINQVLVSNFPPETNEHKIRCLFGAFGKIKNVQWFADEDAAFIEYVDSKSVTQALERHHTVGINLRGKKLSVS